MVARLGAPWDFLLALVSQASLVLAAEPHEHHSYCIVGAGPAGIQLGHFLKHAGRDYVIFERSARAGSFFRRYPRHRGLISLNKRRVREGRSTDFALRHDWNSLIDLRPEGERTPPMTTRSKVLFPEAGILAEYLAEFSEEQAPHIVYNTTVKKVRREEGRSGFMVTIGEGPVKDGNWPPAQPHPDSAEVACDEVVLATGFWRPKGAKVKVDGARHLMGYEDLPETGEDFEGKAVVILGLGNAALETAQELQRFTSETHIFARERALPGTDETGVRFAFETHYVGDIRAGRTSILDTYLLKSLDSFDYNALHGVRRLVIIPCMSTRMCIWFVKEKDCADEACEKAFRTGGQDLNYRLFVAMVPAGSAASRNARELLSLHPEDLWNLEARPGRADEMLAKEADSRRMSMRQFQALQTERGIDADIFDDTWEELFIDSRLLRENKTIMNELAVLRSRYSNDNIRFPMDHIIRAFGWAMDTSILDSSVPLTTSHSGKYPEITQDYQVKDVPGLYIAGTLTHGLDFRKSAGGFIHGFRYTARALFRLLEERNHGIAWPNDIYQLKEPTLESPGPCAGLDGLIRRLRSRINEASGPYQMFQALGDMVVFEEAEESGHWQARYLEEVPLKLFETRYRNRSHLTWVFRYGEGFHGREVLGPRRVGATSAMAADFSNFLHPMLAFTPAGEEEATKRHWLTEDVFTYWSSSALYVPFARFVARAAASATGLGALGERGAFSTELPEDDVDLMAPQVRKENASYTSPSEAADIERETTELRARQEQLAQRQGALGAAGGSEL